jgi:methionine synthase / methylenetetrahydrofolate reductase(NADPH)
MSIVHRFQQRLEQPTPILADGAMGTQLYERIGYRYVCFEELNATDPGVVQGVHRAYIAAGAEIIETNTFGSNRFMLAAQGLEREAERFARLGARLAREAQESMGADVFVAGAIGPLSSRAMGAPASEVRNSFRETIEGLLGGGVDLLILETFGSLDELLVALEVSRECSTLPVLASVTFAEDGHMLSGEDPVTVARVLREAGADMVGANCGFGPQPTYVVLEQMRTEDGPPLSAMPNAGLPSRVEGRLVYTSTPDYFADYASRLSALGIRIIGGCCGTTPLHIAAMRRALTQTTSSSAVDVPPRTPMISVPQAESSANGSVEPQSELARMLGAGEFPISIEMRPSRGVNPTKVLRAAQDIKDEGIKFVDITDSAMARVRMNPFVTAHLIETRVGLEVITHLTTRDRNLMALQADLLAMHALGLRSVLALTGDPPNTNSWAPATGVYDLDSIGLIRLIKGLNEGRDAAGTSIGLPTNFLVGCTLNPTAEDLELQLERFERKVEAGADFVITQAVYDPELFLRVLDRIGPLSIPILLELMPLHSYKNAEFIHNELAGVTLPPDVLARMLEAGNNSDVGLEIAKETFEALRGHVRGLYIVPAFDRFNVAVQLAHEIEAMAPVVHSPTP